MKQVSTEAAINMQGVEVEIITAFDSNSISFKKGAQFELAMSNTTKVIADDTITTSAAARRKWMHDKLDAWIDGGEK